MTVREFIETFNIIDRNVHIYPKTDKDLTNTNGDLSAYVLGIHKFDEPNFLEKSITKSIKKLSKDIKLRLYKVDVSNLSLETLLNSEVWRVSTDCSWYDRVPPICLYVSDFELVEKENIFSRVRKNKDKEEVTEDVEV